MDKRKSRLLVGYDSDYDREFGISNTIKRSFISDFFTSLLLHDKIAMRAIDIPHLFDCLLSASDFHEIIKSDSIRFIMDSNSLPCLVLDNKKTSSISLIRVGTPDNMSDLTYLESRLEKSTLTKEFRNSVLINVEKRSEFLNYNEIHTLLLKEIDYDLQNANLTSAYSIISNDKMRISIQDSYKVLRLMHLDYALIVATKINADSVLLDGAVQKFLPTKFSPALSGKNKMDGVSFFSDILKQKKLSIGELYFNKIISMEDFLEFRNSKAGIKFREWVTAAEYDSETILHEILKSQSTIDNSFLKFFRWFTPNAIGFGSPIAGLISDFADSYLVEKFINGWHPNIYLDNYLKKQIDEKIAANERETLKKSILNKSPKIGRNDPCICLSGKKFKNCCGK